MTIIELLILAIGLSMDAMAAAVCKGLAVRRLRVQDAMITGLYFGGFQALLPLIGYLVGARFGGYVVQVDHWIAFLLLTLMGVGMIREGQATATAASASLSPRAMLPTAFATAVDAMAVGVTFAFLPDTRIGIALPLIGLVTFILSAIGVWIGHLFGVRCRTGAALTGGVLLILMGVRILLAHLGVWE